MQGQVAILLDDMIDTGHTVRLAAEVLVQAGAKEVYALISHGECLWRMCDKVKRVNSISNNAGLLSDVSMKNLKGLPVKKLVVSRLPPGAPDVSSESYRP